MKKMILFPVFVFFSCLSHDSLTRTNEPIDSKSVRATETQSSTLSPEIITVHFSGDINSETSHICLREINRNRQFPLLVDTEWNSRYLIYVSKRRPGFLLKLWEGKKLIQTIRTFAEYEIPIAVGVLARDHIPDSKTAQSSPMSF